MSAKIISLADRRAAASEAATPPAVSDGWMLRLDVFAPKTPGALHRSAVVAARVEGRSSEEVLERYALALEEIAASFRLAASPSVQEPRR